MIHNKKKYIKLVILKRKQYLSFSANNFPGVNLRCFPDIILERN